MHFLGVLSVTTRIMNCWKRKAEESNESSYVRPGCAIVAFEDGERVPRQETEQPLEARQGKDRFCPRTSREERIPSDTLVLA